jgi:hypothetical protein
VTVIVAVPAAHPERFLQWEDGTLTGDPAYVVVAKALTEARLSPVGPVVEANWAEPDAAAALMWAAVAELEGLPVHVLGHTLPTMPRGCCDDRQQPMTVSDLEPEPGGSGKVFLAAVLKALIGRG